MSFSKRWSLLLSVAGGESIRGPGRNGGWQKDLSRAASQSERG